MSNADQGVGTYYRGLILITCAIFFWGGAPNNFYKYSIMGPQTLLASFKAPMLLAKAVFRRPVEQVLTAVYLWV